MYRNLSINIKHQSCAAAYSRWSLGHTKTIGCTNLYRLLYTYIDTYIIINILDTRYGVFEWSVCWVTKCWYMSN